MKIGVLGRRKSPKKRRLSLKGTHLERIDSRRLDEHRKAVSQETNRALVSYCFCTAVLPFAMPLLLEVYESVKRNLSFVVI